jgi:hypothetical protein
LSYKAVVEAVPHVLHAADFSTGHSPAVVVSSEVPLGRRATVVSKGTFGCSSIGLVQIQVCSKDVIRAITFCTCSSMMSLVCTLSKRADGISILVIAWVDHLQSVSIAAFVVHVYVHGNIRKASSA